MQPGVGNLAGWASSSVLLCPLLTRQGPPSQGLTYKTRRWELLLLETGWGGRGLFHFCFSLLTTQISGF